MEARKQKNICGIRIKDCRHSFKSKMTQDQLSAKLSIFEINLDRSAVAKIECGLRQVSDFELKAIAQVLDVNVGWLLGCEPRTKFKNNSRKA